MVELIGERLVFSDLESLFAELYTPSPSDRNSFRAIFVTKVDQSMAIIFARLHDVNLARFLAQGR
jgi:hypothetical protein